jgi:hypothetical protein
MNNFQSLLERIIHAGSAGIILLIVFASFLNQTILAESNPTTSSNSQKEMKASSAAPRESPLTKNSCEKSPMQCSSLCQTALAAESQAAKLEKSSKEARANADKAAQRAVTMEEKTNRKLHKMGISTNASSSGSLSQSKVLKLAAIVPPVFASNEARDRARMEEKESKQYGVNPPPDNSSQEASELLIKLQVASKSAEESQKVAADAKMEADQARAYADSTRQSYKSCLSGMESH